MSVDAKMCTKCLEVKSPEEFYRDNSRKDNLTSTCKTCTRLRTKRYYDRNADQVRQQSRQHMRKIYDPTHAREKHLRLTYGMKMSDYDSLLAAQGGRCHLCQRAAEEGGKILVVDHNHKCCPGSRSCGKCVRRLLCDNCNKGIGLLRDSPEILRRAADYIESFSDEKVGS